MIMTSHAMLMIFFFIMPGVMSGLGNLLVPIQLCVPELLFPKVNNLGITRDTGASSLVVCSSTDVIHSWTLPSLGVKVLGWYLWSWSRCTCSTLVD